MSSPDHTLPAEAAAAQPRTVEHLLLPICYFAAVAVAMAGWLWALGWTLLAAGKWLLA